MMARFSRQHFGVGVALVAWLLLAVHLCSDSGGAHNLGPVHNGDSRTHHQGDASPGNQAPDVDCHSLAWVHQDRGTSGSHGNVHSFGPVVAARAMAQLRITVSDILEATTRAPDSSPPPLYLLHAALLI